MKAILSLLCCAECLRGCHGWTILPMKGNSPWRSSSRHTSVQSSSASSSSSDANKITSEEAEEEEFDQTMHLSILDRNLKRYSSEEQGLLERMGLLNQETTSDDSDEGWDDEIHMSLRFALMSHGNVNGMDGPIHNYANFGACSAFQLSRQALLSMPACRVAAPGVDQEAWSMRLQSLREDPDNNFMDEYQGYRSTLMDGRRFYIRDAVVSLAVLVYEKKPKATTLS
jgi:hypothetical protein